jgi:hypothetical protein
MIWLVEAIALVQLRKYETSKAIMLEGGFELRKWVTNDPELRAYISSTMGDKPDSQPLGEDLTYVEVMSPNLVTPNQAVLGVAWDTIMDEFVFQFDNLLSKCASLEQTKRHLLSASASIFDPLGVIAPVTARIKTICKSVFFGGEKEGGAFKNPYYSPVGTIGVFVIEQVDQ